MTDQMRDALERMKAAPAVVEPAVIRIGGEDFPGHIALEALGVAMNTTLTSGLQGFADRIKNDSHWSQYFEADHALLMEAIAELKRNRHAPPAAPMVPEEWRTQIEKAISRAKVFDDGSDGADAESAQSVVAILRALLAAPAPEQKCKTCNGTGMVDDGEITSYPDGTPYMNGPVKCFKDCPACMPEQREKVEFTDEELQAISFRFLPLAPWAAVVAFARAVLAAHEAKQKGGAT